MLRRYLILAIALLLTTTAGAQWSSDPSANLVVSGGPGDQVVPHLAVVPDDATIAGFTYVGFYNTGATGNYDVGLQLLDRDGVPMFTPGGIIVSAHPQNTWVMDWGLAADHDGNAIVTFADIRTGGSNIRAYKISPNGEFLWGPDGIALTGNNDFKGPPCVAVTDDNHVVVAWMQADADAVLRLQRFAPDGTPLLPEGGIVVSDSADLSPAGNALVPTDDGDVILGWVPNYSFMANRQIKAQRFDAAGAAVWAAPMMVMDDSTVPMGHYFEMTADGTGGALFAWSVTVGSTFGSRVQRLTADGVETLPHNGLYANAAGATGQIGASAVYDPGTDEITLLFTTMNASQSERGLNAQRFDAAGSRLWGSAGTVLMPQDTDLPQTMKLGWLDDAIIGMAIVQPSSAYGTDIVQAFRLGNDGSNLWGTPITIASVGSSKQDLVMAGNGLTMIGVWDDDGDVLAQNVNGDGSIGPVVVAIEGGGSEPAAVPSAFVAHQNYPNPFNPITTIAFDLPHAGPVRLRVYDAAGRLVRDLVNTRLEAARHRVVWDGTDEAGQRQPSGVYHYRLVTPDRVASRAMSLVK